MFQVFCRLFNRSGLRLARGGGSFASTFTIKFNRINGKMRDGARLSSVFNKLKL